MRCSDHSSVAGQCCVEGFRSREWIYLGWRGCGVRMRIERDEVSLVGASLVWTSCSILRCVQLRR